MLQSLSVVDLYLFISYKTVKNKLNIRIMPLYLWKKLGKYYLWSIARNGAETWTLRKADQKYLQSF